MAISERINPEQLNIHKFQEVPETRRERLRFDVDRDIDEDSKHEFFGRIEKERKNSQSPNIVLLSIAKILWSDHEFNFSDEEIENIENYLDQVKRGQIGNEAINTAAEIITTLPKLQQDIPKEKITSWEQEARSWATGLNYYVFVQKLSSLKVINPEGGYYLTPTEIEKTIQVLSELEPLPPKQADWEQLLRYAEAMANIRVLAPEYKIDIPEERWTLMLEEIKKNTSNFQKFKMASFLKILAAHKVEVTAPGVIDIQMYPPADVSDSTPPMPEVRKF